MVRENHIPLIDSSFLRIVSIVQRAFRIWETNILPVWNTTSATVTDTVQNTADYAILQMRHLDSTPFASRSVIVLGALALVLSYVVYVLVVLCLESELGNSPTTSFEQARQIMAKKQSVHKKLTSSNYTPTSIRHRDVNISELKCVPESLDGDCAQT